MIDHWGLGDRDNHCQEEGRAKSVWRETTAFGGIGNWIVYSSLLDSNEDWYMDYIGTWPAK